jgi:nucleotide-binding universal stress UspA family protein
MTVIIVRHPIKLVTGIAMVEKQRHPPDDVLETVRAEGADMIIVGSRGKRMHTFMMGSVSREIANRADIPVLIAR